MFLNNNVADPLRLTFPVRGGVILEPFHTEHGKKIIKRPFMLKENFHRMLMSRSVNRTNAA